jgi:hypothetical protein
MPHTPWNDVIGYHVSSVPLTVGLHKLSGTPTYVGTLLRNTHFQKVENALEAARPAGFCSRLDALYAYPSLGACRAFWEGEQGSKNPSYQLGPVYYKVRLPSPSRVPSALVSRTSGLINGGLPYQEVATEFWNPQKSWSCWEYMDSEFFILSIEPSPTATEAAVYRLAFWDDCSVASDYWPNHKR